MRDRHAVALVQDEGPDEGERGGKCPGATPEELVRVSFEFLLEREPRESIMRRFELAIIGRFFYVVLASIAMSSSFMVSYTRARAEALIPTCKVGFMERPERLVLLILGAAFYRMAPALWVIGTMATATVIHRMVDTWKEIRGGRTLPGATLSA